MPPRAARARVAASLLSTEPFAVDQLTPREVEPRTARFQRGDRFAEVSLRSGVVGQQGLAPSQEPTIKFALIDGGAFSQVRHRRLRRRALAAANVGLDGVRGTQTSEHHVLVPDVRDQR